MVRYLVRAIRKRGTWGQANGMLVKVRFSIQDDTTVVLCLLHNHIVGAARISNPEVHSIVMQMHSSCAQG